MADNRSQVARVRFPPTHRSPAGGPAPHRFHYPDFPQHLSIGYQQSRLSTGHFPVLALLKLINAKSAAAIALEDGMMDLLGVLRGRMVLPFLVSLRLRA